MPSPCVWARGCRDLEELWASGQDGSEAQAGDVTLVADDGTAYVVLAPLIRARARCSYLAVSRHVLRQPRGGAVGGGIDPCRSLTVGGWERLSLYKPQASRDSNTPLVMSERMVHRPVCASAVAAERAGQGRGGGGDPAHQGGHPERGAGGLAPLPLLRRPPPAGRPRRPCRHAVRPI
jgi:hypothetical protein